MESNGIVCHARMHATLANVHKLDSSHTKTRTNHTIIHMFAEPTTEDLSTPPEQTEVNTTQTKVPPGYQHSRTHSSLEFYNKRCGKRRNFYEGVYNRISKVFLKGSVVASVKENVVWLCLFFFSEEKLWMVTMNPVNNEFLEQTVNNLESCGKDLSPEERALWQKEFEVMLDTPKEKPQRPKRKKNQDLKKNLVMKKKTLRHHQLKLVNARLNNHLYFHLSRTMKSCL